MKQEEILKHIYLHCNYPNVKEDEDHILYELEEIHVSPIQVFDKTHHTIYVGKEMVVTTRTSFVWQLVMQN